MRRPSPTLSLATALVAGACIGAGGGAATYAALSSGTTKTVVRQVTVEGSQPTANQSGLSVHEIYSRNYKGVVEITVTDQSVTTPFGARKSDFCVLAATVARTSPWGS